MTTVVTAFSPGTRRGFELLLIVVSVAVSCAAYALVGLAVDGMLPVRLLAIGGGLLGLGLALHVVIRVAAPYADPVLVPIALLINGIGLVMIHRLDLAEDTSFAVRQLGATAIGIVAAGALLVVLRDHRRLRAYTYTAMVVGLVLLLLPLVPGLGQEVRGARIWIDLGVTTFQPAELGKIAVVVFFAGYLVVARDTLSLVGPKVLGLRLPRARDLGPILVAWVASVGILVFERDLGTSLLFFGIFVAMLYVATERVSWIVIGLGLFVAGCLVAYELFGHVRNRVRVWLDPFDPELVTGPSYQVVQGMYGMADGGLLGTGLGRGSPDIVPFAESDFIVASLGEELGLAGLFAVLVLYGILVQRGLRTAIGVRDGFGKLLAAGLAFSIALQVFVVAGGVTGLIPLTGLTMPLLAYGGSSLLGSWLVVALLLRVSDLARRPDLPVRPGAPAPALSPQDENPTQVVRLP
ncbi:FtsW/RodA/SpoVE family cell cycle protein [Aquipuribacter nitratireducens]|uniref:FtsW/RodA/SpoVE family cell cycle protein n=1 Tax=Aquipuribacter nitratireducens TaxID=650104 RepID=A0ABW0GMP5_9MICO